MDYIHENPVKAGLLEKAEDWRWSARLPTPLRCGTLRPTPPTPLALRDSLRSLRVGD
jgi:hypothetical protein